MANETYPAIRLFIDGEWCDSPKGEDVVDPATGEAIGRVPHAARADLDRALAAAERGFATWCAMGVEARSTIMLAATRLMRERADAIGRIMTLEQGKPLAEAKGEVVRSTALIEWDVNEARRAYGRIIPGQPGFRNMVLKQPIGPVAAFTPWNFPASIVARKLGALAAGCSLVLKASEETPGTACAIVQCFADAGLPAGVLNLVFGMPAEISEYLIASPIIRAVTLTGSVPVGKHLAKLAAGEMKPAIMELGGHAPVIVCADADPLEAAKAAIAAKFRNAGQICTCPTRFIVHESHHDTFVEAFAAGAKAVKLGSGFEAGVQMGPLANARRVNAMERLVEDATARGAVLQAGGRRTGNRGFFFEPTVLSEVPHDADVMRSEPFGPLAPIVRFAELDDAITLANSVPYGLAAYGFTQSAHVAAELSERVESGIMSINHLAASQPEGPFGGVKESGYGREGGAEGLDGYMVTKFVSHRTA